MSFQDTLHEVPQLLRACVEGCGTVKSIRALCKLASTLAMHHVRKYCVKLSLDPSESEPLVEVAKFLSQTQLQHLSVEISIPDTYLKGVSRLNVQTRLIRSIIQEILV